MFAKPSASRGKAKKSQGEAAGDGKRQVQRQTKAQRRAGDLRRGGAYEVEDVGGLYGRGEEVEIASEGGSSSSTSESEDDGAAAAGRAPCSQAAPARAPAAAPHFEPPARHGAPAVAAAASGDLEEVEEIEAGLREQLRAWAHDPGLPEDEKRRLVRQLLAQWHPDKNAHIREVATRVFQFVQAEVNRIVGELSGAASEAAGQEAGRQQRRAQRAAEKAATASAVRAAREGKQRRRAPAEEPAAAEAPAPEAAEDGGAEWSLVVGHGPATTSLLRPWPRSHFSLLVSPLDARAGEVLLFGGEAYDGRELTFYSDLYRLSLAAPEDGAPLPWEKLYASVPMIPGPEARSSHQAVAWGTWLYVFGGEWSSRDQRRYRQFGDCWRFDVSAAPGTRWERVQADAPPCPRSGHRMACGADGQALLFGGFVEDRRRRATYLADCHALDLRGGAWREAVADRRARGPGKRAGHLFWTAGGAAYVYGGARPRKGTSERLDALDDMWRAPVGLATSSTAPALRWEPLSAQGQGPGRRMGLCQCAVSQEAPSRRLVFGGVADLSLPSEASGAARGRPGGGKEVSLFMSDLFMLDCSQGQAPVWSRLWPAPGTGVPAAVPSLDPAALPSDVLAKGGGVDALAMVAAAESGGRAAEAAPQAPRGRMAAGCAVVGGAIWVFGGVCESGPRQEVTLDDLWRLELGLDGEGRTRCGRSWECVLPLSERATVWFDSESESEEEEEAGAAGAAGAGVLAVPSRDPGVLSKKQQKEEAKKARMDFKRERQLEKCEEKLDKRELKKERQRQEARAKAGAP